MRHEENNTFLIHGHRGCRGLLPENSIPSFIKACDLGVDALELDVVVTMDGQILVSHDPFMHHEICCKPDGSRISEEEERNFNIYAMPISEAKNFLCGTQPHPRFPDQKQIECFKPSLVELVDEINLFCSRANRRPPKWTIEIKSSIEGDRIFHPAPDVYAEIFLSVFKTLNLPSGYIIQSFDHRILNALHNLDRDLNLVLLFENLNPSLDAELQKLDFIPFGIGPHYLCVDDGLVNYCNMNRLQLLVWTVNDVHEMSRLSELGVKNIITDFPDMAIAFRERLVEMKTKKRVDQSTNP
jgi:glycerophosphoryl diester phosphodiesterase